MKIKKALEPTGKAEGCNSFLYRYAMLNGQGALYWYERKYHKEIGAVNLHTLLTINWQPYHDKKEIRPEKAGELWCLNERGFWYVTQGYQPNEKLGIVHQSGTRHVPVDKNIIHSQNGWERIHPPVEDDSIEKVVIDRVIWNNGDKCFPTTLDIHPAFGVFNDFIDKPPMKMILEIPKKRETNE